MKLMKLIIAAFMALNISAICASVPHFAVTGEIGQGSVYDLEQLLLEKNVETITPAEMVGELNFTVGIEKLLVGIDGQILSTPTNNENEKVAITTIAGQVGYALYNDEDKMVGFLATIGYAGNAKFKSVDGKSKRDSYDHDMVIGGKMVAYFSIVGGTVAEVKVLPFTNVVQAVSDLDIHLFKIWDLANGNMMLEIELNPKILYITDGETGRFKAATYLTAEVITSKYSFSVYGGVGVDHDFHNGETTPYAEISFRIGVDTDVWGHRKDKK